MLNAIQNTIRVFANQWFTVIPIWLYAILGQLLIVYFEKIAANLGLLIENNTRNQNSAIAKQTFVMLRSLKAFPLAIELLHHHFNTMLMANCFLDFIIMLTSSFYLIEYFGDGLSMAACWDVMDVIDSFVRFWLVCHISDKMRKAVSYRSHRSLYHE